MNIVFIAPEFFTFHQKIQSRLEELGHKVHFIPDRPSRKAIVKILIRKARFILEPYLNSFFCDRAAQIPAEQISEVFIIRGEGLTARALSELRKRFSKARFQLYLWDSVARSPGCRDLIPLVERVWTYDLRDAKENPSFKFTPNFYTLPNLRAKETDFKWDLVFFGTAHADRLKVISKTAKNLPARVRFYRFFYFQSPIMYYFRKIFDRAFHFFKPDELSLKPKFGKEWEEVISETSAVLDVHHPEQGGLTIRTLESLAMGFKVVTTDASIKEYEFYDPNQIQVIDRENPRVDSAFLEKPNRFRVHPSIQRLELTSWLKNIFD